MSDEHLQKAEFSIAVTNVGILIFDIESNLVKADSSIQCKSEMITFILICGISLFFKFKIVE